MPSWNWCVFTVLLLYCLWKRNHYKIVEKLWLSLHRSINLITLSTVSFHTFQTSINNLHCIFCVNFGKLTLESVNRCNICALPEGWREGGDWDVSESVFDWINYCLTNQRYLILTLISEHVTAQSKLVIFSAILNMKIHYWFRFQFCKPSLNLVTPERCKL